MPRFNYIALVIGICLAIAAAYSAYSTWDFVSSSVEADGSVVRLSPGPHHPIVAFTTASGEQYRFTANGFVSQEVGDHVRVRYRPDDALSSATLDTVGAIWPVAIALSAFSALWIALGLRNVQFRGWSDNDRSTK